MSDTEKVIDLTYLQSIADGNQSIVIELIEIFLEQINEFSNGFKGHFSKKDWKSLAALAHKAKSSVISMGLEDLSYELKNLELLCRDYASNIEGFSDNNTEELISSKIEKFIKVCGQAKEELIEIINTK